LRRGYEEQRNRTLRRVSKRIPKARNRKSGFEVEWVKFPLRWRKRLREAGVGAATYDLAITILAESFKLDQMAVKEIILSEEVTGLSRWSQYRAVNNLIRLKLIKVRRGIGKAIRVIDLYIY
jgi:hypothetical protein